MTLAKTLGMDFGWQMSASAVFKELADSVAAYAGLRFPALKDESKPVQAKHQINQNTDAANATNALREQVNQYQPQGEKISVTPNVGHELFRLGTLTSRTPQIHLLAGGNPKPETVLISPLYQITRDANLRRAVEAVAAD